MTNPSRGDRYEKRHNPDGQWEVEYVEGDTIVLGDLKYGNIETTVSHAELENDFKKVE